MKIKFKSEKNAPLKYNPESWPMDTIRPSTLAGLLGLKFIYSEKATKFCEISTEDLSLRSASQIYGGDFAKFCGLLKLYEL